MQRPPAVRVASRVAALVATTTLIVSACGGSDSSSSVTTEAVDTTDVETTVPDTTAAPETTTPETTAPATTEPPATTAPATTAPATTEPPATTEATATATTAPPASDEQLAQFCFDSEQVYIADYVMSAMGDATPDVAQAAVGFLSHSIDLAVESAPPDFEDQPLLAQQTMAELVALFSQYDFDIDALLAGPDGETAVGLAETIGTIMDQLTVFLGDVCDSKFRVLDSQGIKLGAVIGEAAAWSLLAVTNVAGDIRMLVPSDWTDWLGSTDVGEATFLQVSTDNAQFDATWAVPGAVATVFYVVAGVADPTTRLDLALAASVDDDGAPVCVEVGTEPYADPVYSGELHLYEMCGGVDTGAAVLLATDADQSVEIVIEFQFPGGTDRALLDQMLATFAAGA